MPLCSKRLFHRRLPVGQEATRLLKSRRRSESSVVEERSQTKSRMKVIMSQAIMTAEVMGGSGLKELVRCIDVRRGGCRLASARASLIGYGICVAQKIVEMILDVERIRAVMK